MGQLIKLQDYISRYEQDIYRYPSQFVRLKQQQWERLKAAFISGELDTLFIEPEESTGVQDETGIEEKQTMITKVKRMFSKTAKKNRSRDVSQTASGKSKCFFVKFPRSAEKSG